MGAVTAARMRTASRPSRKTMIALFATTTACGSAPRASVGSGAPCEA